MTKANSENVRKEKPDRTISDLVEAFDNLRLDIANLNAESEQTAEINRKLGVLMQNLNDRLLVIEATMNATVFRHIFTHDTNLEDVVRDDEISYAEALAASRRSGPGQIEVQSMPDEGGSAIHRFKLPGNRSARIKTSRSGEIVGQPFIDEPSGDRSEMSEDDAYGLLSSTFGLIRRAPVGMDHDPNFDSRGVRGL